MVKIIIKTQGAAFTDGVSYLSPSARNIEVARILKKLANQLEQSAETGIDWNSVILLDINGNSVGSYTYSPADGDLK